VGAAETVPRGTRDLGALLDKPIEPLQPATARLSGKCWTVGMGLVGFWFKRP